MRLWIPHLIGEAVIERHECSTHIAVSGRWSDGVQERWSDGVQERLSNGAHESWIT